MSNYELMQIIDGIRKFPIGEIAADRKTLLCKAEVVSYLATYQEQFEHSINREQVEADVRTFLGEVISLKQGEEIPDIATAERFLKLSSGFLQDYEKVQYIKEHHPEFSQIYSLIATQMTRASQKSEEKQY